MKYTLTIEPDNIDEGKWMVVIRGNKLVGIPLRGVSKEDANDKRDALSFAFEFGLKEARERIQQFNFSVD